MLRLTKNFARRAESKMFKEGGRQMSTEHDEGAAGAAESPADKLDDTPPPGGSPTPGTQKPESEVQQEKGMNTE
jgi:hypothetical protein